MDSCHVPGEVTYSRGPQMSAAYSSALFLSLCHVTAGQMVIPHINIALSTDSQFNDIRNVQAFNNFTFIVN